MLGVSADTMRATALQEDNDPETYVLIDAASGINPHTSIDSNSSGSPRSAIFDLQEHVNPLARSLYSSYTEHSNAPRISTESVIAAKLREQYPDLDLTINPTMGCDLLGFARTGAATATVLGPEEEQIYTTSFRPPARRYDFTGGAFIEQIRLMSFSYKFGDAQFLLYVVEGRDGDMAYPVVMNNFILSSKGSLKAVHGLIEAVTRWGMALHEEVLVFDQGTWMKDKTLYKAIVKSSWDDVILDAQKKKDLIEDVNSFFTGEGNYAEFAVPWKRGLILFGPPGNGKTISIKALMHSLSELKSPTVELLYVKTLVAFGGPERSIRSIFLKARAMAPCVLIFEDLDSLISDSVRSYFLNEVDGLESNHGIMMIGSTNHIERLDPGIAKRPSRFDRKYLFALPTRNERVQYCEYWRKKLASNKKVDFPEELCGMIADITKDFSFAYLKEAFVASLLTIVARKEKEGGGDEDGRDRAEKSLLWKEIQKQIKNLRDEMDNTANDVEKKKPIIAVPTQNPVVQMATTGASRVQF